MHKEICYIVSRTTYRYSDNATYTVSTCHDTNHGVHFTVEHNDVGLEIGERVGVEWESPYGPPKIIPVSQVPCYYNYLVARGIIKG